MEQPDLDPLTRRPLPDPGSDRWLRQIAERTDPARGLPIGAPHLSGEQLRLRAEHRTDLAPGRLTRGWLAVCATWRWSVPATVLTTGIAIIGFAMLTLPTGSRRPAPTANRLAAPAPLHLPATSVPARPELLALAERVQRLPTDAGGGRYTFVHTQVWSLDTIGADGVVAQDRWIWWAADFSGRISTTVLPAQQPGFVLAAWTGSTLPPGTHPDAHEFPPDQLSVAVPEPAADPSVLAGQLAEHQPPENGGQSWLRGVADMAKYHDLTPAQRSAALTVLAYNTDAVSHGTVTDRAGRNGLAITVDAGDGTTRDLLVIDPATGGVLSYEQTALVAPPGMPDLPTPTTTSYVLYLGAGRTDTKT